MPETPKVLLIIVTYNAAEYLGDCLSSLARLQYPAASFKVLVIDNGSTDGSVELIRRDFLDIEIIVNPQNVGFAGGNNIGMQYAIEHSFDYVYLLNQDTVVDVGFLGEAVRVAVTDPRIGAVQSKLLLHDTPELINSRGNMIHFLGFAFAGGYKEPDRPLVVSEIAYASGAACLLRVLALKEVGLFHEEFFMYHEDTDLGWRLWIAGWRVVLAPASVVYHKYEFSRSIKKYYFMERNRLMVLIQNYKWATLILLAPLLLPFNLVMIPYAVLAGWGKEEWRAHWYLASPRHWLQILKRRRAVQGTRKQKDRDVIAHFTGRIEFQDVGSPLLRYFINPIFNAYWKVIKQVIWW